MVVILLIIIACCLLFGGEATKKGLGNVASYLFYFIIVLAIMGMLGSCMG